MQQASLDKQKVHDFWDEKSCGESLYLDSLDAQGYTRQAEVRYSLEPYIVEFAGFKRSQGKRVLEIGVGLGADHLRFAENHALLYGIDLTERALSHTKRRLSLFGLSSNLSVGDAEHLDFPDDHFDTVYSWGVLHHSPDTPKAVSEVFRVLKSGGEARVMIYHTLSMVGFMLWIRYALLAGKPWRSLSYIYAHYLESPGTKAYTVAEARKMFGRFSKIHIDTVLTHGDLLDSKAGQRHRGFFLNVARFLWPRRIIRFLFPRCGLFMLISAVK